MFSKSHRNAPLPADRQHMTCNSKPVIMVDGYEEIPANRLNGKDSSTTLKHTKETTEYQTCKDQKHSSPKNEMTRTKKPIEEMPLRLLHRGQMSNSIHGGLAVSSDEDRVSFLHNLDSYQRSNVSEKSRTQSQSHSDCVQSKSLPAIFAMATSSQLISPSFTRYNILPPIQPCTRREPTLMADPPSPQLKVQNVLPILQEQLNVSPVSSGLSQSALFVHNLGSRSTQEKSKSCLSIDSCSSPYSLSLDSITASMSLGSTPSPNNESCYRFPAPPSTPNLKKHNQRSRPRRLVPLNTLNVAKSYRTKQDEHQVEPVTDIQETIPKKIASQTLNQEVEAVSPKERQKIQEYQRSNLNRRTAICRTAIYSYMYEDVEQDIVNYQDPLITYDIM